MFSDSHTDTEVVYEWGPVTVEPYLTIPKYSLVRLETSSCVLQTSIGKRNIDLSIYVITSDKGGGKCVCPRSFVCLSVCEQDYSKTHALIWMKCCVSTDVETWTNLLTFEPDPG